MNTKSAAIVTIYQPADMTAKGRRAVAAWLRRQATLLERHSKQLSRRFTTRYLYRLADGKS